MATNLPLIIVLSFWVLKSDVTGQDQIVSVILKSLDIWDSKCSPPHIESNYSTCSPPDPDYDTGICCYTEHAAKVLNERLSHFRQEVRDQIKNSVSSCDHSSPVLEGSTLSCFDSKKSSISKCLEDQVVNYCAWKSKNDSTTIYSAEFKKLWCSSSDCVLNEISRCGPGHRQNTINYFTELLNAPDGKNPITCGARAVVSTKLPAVFVVVLALGFYVF